MKLSTPVIFAGIFFSGICFYFSNGLSGDYWWLLWIAPVPVLLISLQLSPGKAFLASFLTYFIGRLSWFTYLKSVLPPVPMILFMILLPFTASLIILFSRKIILKSRHWISMFAFPASVVTLEYLFALFSRDGTFGSLAYTQANFLPVVQIASITGIMGISFVVCLFSSAVAVSIYFWEDRSIRKNALVFTACILLIVFAFGLTRLNSKPGKERIVAGLTTLEKNVHLTKDIAKTENASHLIYLYEPSISSLAKQGAHIIVLPEKMIAITNGNADTLISLWKTIASRYNTTLIIGYTKDNGDTKTNNALVIAPSGQILNDYSKVNLFEGEVYDGISPGKNIGLFDLNKIKSGVAICKDMDFQQYMHKYSRRAHVLYVPAWDFDKDDWLHSRMAILRGVENGYGIVRNALQGDLTISDDRGRVLFESTCSKGQSASLIGSLPVDESSTIYGRTGDWFSILSLLATLSFGVFVFFRKKTGNAN